jgi:hypothetical protein
MKLFYCKHTNKNVDFVVNFLVVNILNICCKDILAQKIIRAETVAFCKSIF